MARQHLYTIGQARELLAKRGVTVSYRTLRRYIETGKIAANFDSRRSRTSGQWRVTLETIEAFASTYGRRK
jgi:predicted site-specific integrase-resolvase